MAIGNISLKNGEDHSPRAESTPVGLGSVIRVVVGIEDLNPLAPILLRACTQREGVTSPHNAKTQPTKFMQESGQPERTGLAASATTTTATSKRTANGAHDSPPNRHNDHGCNCKTNEHENDWEKPLKNALRVRSSRGRDSLNRRQINNTRHGFSNPKIK